MEIKKVYAVWYSATGTTDRVVNTIADELTALLEVPLERIPFTKPADRAKQYAFGEGDLVVVGTPTYAGRMPNKIMPDFRENLKGNGALAVPVVLFGNRAYENSLAELCALMEENGFHTLAAAAFVGQHAFAAALAEGRPDWDDKRLAKNFAKSISDKLKYLTEIPKPVSVPGDPEAPYYIPKDLDGQPAKFLKAKPKTNLSKCSGCGACARLCPMGAIDAKRVFDVPGTCIKCQACVRKCTRGAKYFDDPAFLSHKAMLEATYAEPKEAELFLS